MAENKEYPQINESSMQINEPVVAYQRTQPIGVNPVMNENKGLNKAQLHFLQTLQYIKTDEMLEELQQIVSDYYIKKAQEEVDRLWDEGVLGDFLLNEHLRTPYK